MVRLSRGVIVIFVSLPTSKLFTVVADKAKTLASAPERVSVKLPVDLLPVLIMRIIKSPIGINSMLFIGISTQAQTVEAPPVSYVSVNPYNLHITVAWYESLSANIDFVRVNYIYDQTTLIKAKKVQDIARNQHDSLTFNVDTMYIFPQEVKEMPLSFAVDAYASTGQNSTNLREYHSTMFCTAQVSTCPLQINLEWTAYHGYNIQVDEYQIIEVTGTNTEQIIQIVNASELHTQIMPNQDEEHRFFVRAVFKDIKGNVQRSTSNMVLTNNNVFKYPKFITPYFISVTPENAVQMAFTVDTNTDFSDYIVQRSLGDSLHFETIDTVQFAVADITPLRLELENEFSAETLKYYRIAALDNCGFPIMFSPAITPVCLHAEEQSDVEHLLQWTTPPLWTNGYNSFRIFRSYDNNAVEEIGTSDAPNFTDNLSDNYKIGAHICYYMETSQQIENETVTITSNTVCIEKNYRLVVPNAINPNSSIVENRTFQPKYAFVSGDYELQIFDRTGARIFISHDINVGWDGTMRGNQLPAGVYQYKITVKMPNGVNIERLGSVNVVYEAP